ncbi:MAG: hypothetical protein PHH90_08205 [Limnochordia bacterium]|nr:hypothetical protein [Limnochordia bacterium]
MRKLWLLAIGVLMLIFIQDVTFGVDLPAKDGLQLWLRADDGVRTAGQFVESMVDHSGQGNNATGSETLLIENVLNSHSVIRFTGPDSFLIVPHNTRLNADSAFSIFVVFSYQTGFRVAQKKDGHGAGEDAWFLSPQQGLGVSGKWYDDKQGWLFSPSIGDYSLMSSVFNGHKGTISTFGNGRLLAVVDGVEPQKPNEDALYIGRRNHSSGGNLVGEIAEIIIYSTALSETERTVVEEYLMDKYGL